jgi:hypothetical protein
MQSHQKAYDKYKQIFTQDQSCLTDSFTQKLRNELTRMQKVKEQSGSVSAYRFYPQTFRWLVT